MIVLPPFPDVQTILAALIQAKLKLADGSPLPGNRTGDQRPDELKDRMPFIEAFRFGGGDDGITDYPEVTINVYAPSYAIGEPLSRAVRALLTAAPHAVPVGSAVFVIDEVTAIAGPLETVYGDDAVRLWTATYRVGLRRHFL